MCACVFVLFLSIIRKNDNYLYIGRYFIYRSIHLFIERCI